MKRMWSRKELKEMVDLIKKNVNTLVDSDGHDRFIEGDITIETITGVTQTYGKWALCGYHLMIAVAGSIDNGTTLTAGTFAKITDLPAWVYDKIVPMIAGVSVEQKTFLVFNDDYSNQSITGVLQKLADGKLQIYNGSLTASKDRSFRFIFDLIID